MAIRRIFVGLRLFFATFFTENGEQPILKIDRYVTYPSIRGAGDGSRTHTTSLEGWDSTAELHPQNTVYSIIEKPLCQYLFCQYFVVL